MSKSKKSQLNTEFKNIKTSEDYFNWYRKYQQFVDESEEQEKSLENARLSWDEMFLEVAKVVAKRSKDPHTKVGAVLVDKHHHILSIGYNAEPRGFKYKFDWTTREKYQYVIHAEMNAIANAATITSNFENSTMYLTLSPCCQCMKFLIQYGVKTIYYIDEYHDIEDAKFIAKNAGIKLIKV